MRKIKIISIIGLMVAFFATIINTDLVNARGGRGGQGGHGGGREMGPPGMGEESGGNKPPMPMRPAKMARILMKLGDQDNDQKLTKAELTKALRKFHKKMKEKHGKGKGHGQGNNNNNDEDSDF